MNKREDEIYKELMLRYKEQWDKNTYARGDYDSNLEAYRGYRDTSEFPLVYNESFNRILPIIYTILARFMDQVYQTSNIISVKPRKARDLERSKKVEAVLNFQMETLNDLDMQGGSYLTMMKWFFNTITFGKGIVKAYWKKEERISPKRIALPVPKFDRMGNVVGMDVIDHISQEMQTAYDGPYVEVLHNKLFVPHPEYKNIQQMPYVFCVYKKSLDDIKRNADKGIYRNLGELGTESIGGASDQSNDSREAFVRSLTIDGAFQSEDEDTERKAPMIDIVECYGKMILKDEPYTVGSGYKLKGKEEEIIAHVGNYRTLLSLQRNPYNTRPFFDMGCYMNPELYWDLGLVQLTKGIQQQADTLANLRIQNVMMQINQMLKVNTNADIDPEALTWRPFGIVPVEDPTDVEPLVVPDYNSNLFMEQESFYKNTIQDLMGMYDYNMGQTPERQERVGVVYGIQSMGEARTKLLLMSMDYLGMRPLLKHMMLLNTFHLPSGFEFRISGGEEEQFGQIFGNDIHADFDFAARYTSMEPALGKQFRAQQLIQMAQLWNENPWVNQYQFTKVLMELLDIQEAQYLLKKPQQIQQEQEQQVKMQMMAEQAKNRMETEGKLAVGGQKVQGALATGAQGIQGDLMLEAIQSETDLEVARIGARSRSSNSASK